MKTKRILLLAIAFVLIFSLVISAEPPEILAEGAILIDGGTGVVLFEQKADEKLFPASMTKMMTGLLAIEHIDEVSKKEGILTEEVLAKIITMPKWAVNVPAGSSRLWLDIDEEISVYNLLCGMLIASGNDASNGLAEFVSGDEETFVALMNSRAKELGMDNTHFINAHGFHDDKHYSTARDMATLAKKAMESQIIRDIVKKKNHVIEPTNKQPQQRKLITTNLLLENGKYYYSTAIGIKTGYTVPAKNCLASAARIDEMEIISVIMGASVIDNVNNSFAESKRLLDYGFNAYKRVKIVAKDSLLDEVPIKNAKGAKTIKLLANTDEYNIFPKDVNMETEIKTEFMPEEEIEAPIAAGTVLGKVEYTYTGTLHGGKVIATVDLVADRDYEFSVWAAIFGFLFAFMTSPFFLIPLLLFIIAIIVVRQKRYDRRRRNRSSRR